jgi:hypothetical protein
VGNRRFNIYLRRSGEFIHILPLASALFEDALAHGIVSWMSSAVRNVDNFVAENFAIACNDVQGRKITKRALKYRRDKGVCQLPDTVLSESQPEARMQYLLVGGVLVYLRQQFKRNFIWIIHQDLWRFWLPFFEVVSVDSGPAVCKRAILTTLRRAAGFCLLRLDLPIL